MLSAVAFGQSQASCIFSPKQHYTVKTSLFIKAPLSMEIVNSNEKWFIHYTNLRNIILLILLLIVGYGTFFESAPLIIKHLASYVGLPVLLTLLVFDYLQKPSLFELRKGEGQLAIDLYVPDARFIFFYNPKKKKTITIAKDAQVEVLGTYKSLPWQRKLQFLIQQPNGEVLTSPTLDFSWATKADIALVLKTVKEHNQGI